jgi:hypothetical protein
LTYWHAGWPSDISVTIGSMDQPEQTPPVDHTWMSEAIHWDVPKDGLAQFPSDRP